MVEQMGETITEENTLIWTEEEWVFGGIGDEGGIGGIWMDIGQ